MAKPLRGKALARMRANIEEQGRLMREGPSRNEGTRPNMPGHIWMENVHTEALRRGGPRYQAIVNEMMGKDHEVRARMVRAGNMGEPVWMAADELEVRARGVLETRPINPVGKSLRDLQHRMQMLTSKPVMPPGTKSGE